MRCVMAFDANNATVNLSWSTPSHKHTHSMSSCMIIWIMVDSNSKILRFHEVNLIILTEEMDVGAGG